MCCQKTVGHVPAPPKTPSEEHVGEGPRSKVAVSKEATGAESRRFVSRCVWLSFSGVPTKYSLEVWLLQAGAEKHSVLWGGDHQAQLWCQCWCRNGLSNSLLLSELQSVLIPAIAHSPYHFPHLVASCLGCLGCDGGQTDAICWRKTSTSKLNGWTCPVTIVNISRLNSLRCRHGVH